MRYFDRVIVALANAPVDRDLLRYARLVRSLGNGGGSFTFVHVLPPADVVAARRGPATTLADTRRALAAMIGEEFGDFDAATLIVRSGDPVDFLLGLAAEGGADLVMVGHRKNARGRRSFSRRLAIKAPCSVWMVPEGAPASISSVLAAVDLSLPSAQALSLATLVANKAGLDRCTVLHVLEPSEPHVLEENGSTADCGWFTPAELAELRLSTTARRGMEFLVRGATEFGEPGVCMSFEETAEELTQNVRSLGFDLADLVDRKQLMLDFVRVERSEIEETGDYDGVTRFQILRSNSGY